MVLQAFIDESFAERGTFVLDGHVASAESWANFAREWYEMLPFAPRNKEGKFQFKIAEMAVNPDRVNRIPGFLRIIENDTILSLAAVIDWKDIARAKARVQVPNVNINGDFRFNKAAITCG